VEQGATVLTGGGPVESLNTTGGTFFAPTVLTGMTQDMAPFLEETFGPVAPLASFATEEEAVAIANNTR
jgi:acyl-CoA reductase-like NAD-dependent aldehyde dehydrogenase